MIFLAALAVAVVCAVASEQIAEARGRSAVGYGLLGFLLGPLGLIAAAVTPPNAQVLDQRGLGQGKAKQCPACREVIRADARSCPRCQHQLTAAELAEADAQMAAALAYEKSTGRRRTQQTIALIAVITLGLVYLWWKVDK